MKLSNYFIPTLKETPKDTVAISHQLMIKSGMIKPVLSGVFSYLPLGLRVFRKIENIIREEMDKIGLEFHLPSLTPLEVWNKSGRIKHFEEVAYWIEKEDLLLAPTHEELFTMICKDHINSYKQLPQIWYQIQKKFRKEARCKSGVIRSREFTMKDSYSFDTTEEGLEISYQKHRTAYLEIFKRCGLDVHIIESDNGIMGGSKSEEFVVRANCGEDYRKSTDGTNLVKANKDDIASMKVIELGHIFKLGTKYTEAFDACYLDENGKKKPLIMGSYGIGIDRMIAAIIEQFRNHDEFGIKWPKNVAPFQYQLICTDSKNEILKKAADEIYETLTKVRGFEVLYDDRLNRAGDKFYLADLIGNPIQIIVGKSLIESNFLDLKFRNNGKKIQIPAESVIFVLNNLKNYE